MQKIIQFIQIQPLMSELGYTTFVVLLYVFMGSECAGGRSGAGDNSRTTATGNHGDDSAQLMCQPTT